MSFVGAMTSTIESVGILKADAKGRVRVPRERQEALLDELERSGLSGAKFGKRYRASCGLDQPPVLSKGFPACW